MHGVVHHSSHTVPNHESLKSVTSFTNMSVIIIAFQVFDRKKKKESASSPCKKKVGLEPSTSRLLSYRMLTTKPPR